MTEIRLAFLDRARIIRSGEEVSPRELPTKLVGLLALLAAEATRSVPVERVCLLLWPDAGEALARKSLNQVLVRARRVLPGALERPAEHQLGLSPEVASDVHDLLFGSPFQSCSDISPHADFEFLPGFSIRGCPELNDWLDSTRARVRARAADAALERMGGLAPADACCWAALAYRLNRADERAAAALVRGTAAVSGPAAAWAAFTEHRRWLAEDLDITPSARLTAIAAEACRQAGALAVEPAAASPASAMVAEPPVEDAAVAKAAVATTEVEEATVAVLTPPAGPVPSRGWRGLGIRRRELVAGIVTLVLLSVATWQTMLTPGAEAARSSGAEASSSPGVVVMHASLGGGAKADSAVRLAAEHLAQHDISSEVLVVDGAFSGLRLLLPNWRGEQALRVSLGEQAYTTTERLAAALTDSVLALVVRAEHAAAPTPHRAMGEADRFLLAAQGTLATARGLMAEAGPAPALMMLARADSLAALAGRSDARDWQPYALRAEIANLVFWQKLASRSIEPAVLQGGARAADSAVLLGGGAAALKARAKVRFSQWVQGGAGSVAAGNAAQRDYAELVRLSPSDGEAWVRLAQLYHAHGRVSDAYSAASQALPYVSGSARLETFMELFLTALDRRDFAVASHWCSELGFHRGRSWLAATCAAMYAWADPGTVVHPPTSPLLDAATGLQPSMEAQLALLRAGADLVRGNDSAARALIRQALPLVNRDPEVASIWAGVLVELGMADSAVATLRRYLRDTPSSRVIVSRPWFRPLYRANESWDDFVSRISSEPRETVGVGRTAPPPAAPPVLRAGPAPYVRDADDS